MSDVIPSLPGTPDRVKPDKVKPDGRQMRGQLTELLKELCLPAVRACYEETARLAAQEELSYEQFLLELCARESEMRRHNKTLRLLRQSRLPLEKTWDGFDRGRLPPRVRQQVCSLLDGSFLDRQENILAFGNPGSGKTHLLCGLSQELVRQGRRVLYTTCSLLVQELLAAKRDLTLSRTLRRLSGFAGLIIDDLGYVQQSREEMEVLFTLLADRYERGSVLITSNLPFSQWESIFKDPMTTAAAIDRLVHHSVILELNIPSYRVEEARNGQARQDREAAEPKDAAELTAGNEASGKEETTGASPNGTGTEEP